MDFDDEAPQMATLPELRPPWRKRWRHDLIMRLARADTVLLNAEMVTPPGWELRRNTPETVALIADVHFLPYPRPAIPGTPIMAIGGFEIIEEDDDA